jgi:hypothetical protein
MKQISRANTVFALVTKRTRERVFLDEMNLVVPSAELVRLIEPFASRGTTAKGGRLPFAVPVASENGARWCTARQSVLKDRFELAQHLCWIARNSIAYTSSKGVVSPTVGPLWHLFRN